MISKQTPTLRQYQNMTWQLTEASRQKAATPHSEQQSCPQPKARAGQKPPWYQLLQAYMQQLPYSRQRTPFPSYTEQKQVLCSQQNTAAVVTRTRHSPALVTLKYFCYLNHILSAFCSAPCRPHTCSVGLRKWLPKRNQLTCSPHLLQSTASHLAVVMITPHLKSNYKWLDKKASTKWLFLLIDEYLKRHLSGQMDIQENTQ